MPLQKIQFRPGIVRDITSYSNEGGWWDADKIRFRLGFPETIGGWTKYSSSQFLGSCRAIHQWTALDGTNYTALGTNLKLYIENGGTYYDITPIRRTVALGANPFQTRATGTAELIVTDAASGAALGDYVTYSGTTAFDNYTAPMLNTEFSITEILTANTYVVTATGATSSAGGVNGGGAGVTAAYQISIGPDTQTFGTGWGTGPYSRGTWGSAYAIGVSTGNIRLWSLDNFGEDLVAAVRGGGVYYWDKTDGVAARAVSLEDEAGANQAPTVVTGVAISDADRHVIVFGANEEGSATQDPMLIRWSDAEDLLEWETTTTTTAGGQRLSTGSQIVGWFLSRQQTLIWTDKALYGMQFGGEFVFGFNLLASNSSVIGPNAAAEAGDTVYWMDQREFRLYNGSVQAIPCTVQTYVFEDFNYDQRYKVFCGTNTRFNEVWWFYPSSESDENDRYVMFNYVDGTWCIGTIERTSWLDVSLSQGVPIATASGYIYLQETGYDADTVALEPLVECSDMDIGDGEEYTFIRRFIPDLRFRGPNTTGNVTYTVLRKNFSGQDWTEASSSDVTSTTTESFVRVRGRRFAYRVTSSESDMGWRLGSTEFDIQPDGKKV